MERRHGNVIPSAVFDIIRLILEGELTFDWALGNLALRFCEGKDRVEQPGGNWNRCRKSKQDGCLQFVSEFQ